MSSEAMKANQHDTWRSVAPGWKKRAAELTRQTAPVTARMVESLQPGARVLDIACGVGDPAIAAARKVAPDGSVLAVDQVEEMLAFARQEAAAAGVRNIQFRRVDGEQLDEPAASFDAATIRFGLMFMPDAAACLERVRRALKPGGTVSAAVWQGPERNPWAAIPLGILKRHVDVPAPPPGAPGLFALADREHLASVFRAAGFPNVRLEEVELVMTDYDRGEDFLSYMLDLAGPITQLHAKVPPTERAAVDAEIARAAEKAGGGRAKLTGGLWLASATKES